MLLKYYNINKLGVGSNMIFLFFYLTTLLFYLKNHAAQVFFVSFFGNFSAKIAKNTIIFCNFFSLCINKLEEI